MHRPAALPRAERDRPARHVEQREHAHGAAAARRARRADGYVRSQFVRCDSTTPFGRPVLPLVKKMTCGSRSSRPATAGGVAAPRSTRSRCGIPVSSASSIATSECEVPAEQQTRPRVLGDRPHLADGRARVQRREDRTDLGQRGEHGNRFERRCRPTTAPGRPGRCRPRPAPCATRFGLGVDLAERQRVVVERGRDRVGRDARRVREDLADEEHGGIVAPTGPHPKPRRPKRAGFPLDNDC